MGRSFFPDSGAEPDVGPVGVFEPDETLCLSAFQWCFSFICNVLAGLLPVAILQK